MRIRNWWDAIGRLREKVRACPWRCARPEGPKGRLLVAMGASPWAGPDAKIQFVSPPRGPEGPALDGRTSVRIGPPGLTRCGKQIYTGRLSTGWRPWLLEAGPSGLLGAMRIPRWGAHVRLTWWALLLLGACLALPGGCGARPRHDTLVLNWKPEPEFGGIYQQVQQGSPNMFQGHGLTLELIGGPDAPVVQMVDSGTATFGIASADEVVMARARGADIVAVFATYQTCPQGLMVHAERGLKDIREVFDPGVGVVAMEQGLPYVKVLERRYGLGRVQVVPYTGSIGLWMKDPNMAQQCFVTAEPIDARQAGAKPQVFLIADCGYNPYTGVVITRGKLLREQPGKVKALVAALREGWGAYLRDPKPANERMGKLNPAMDAYTFAAAAKAQQPLIQDPEASPQALGTMTKERWQTLIDQLQEIKVIEQAPKATDCFVDVDTLPEKP